MDIHCHFCEYVQGPFSKVSMYKIQVSSSFSKKEFLMILWEEVLIRINHHALLLMLSPSYLKLKFCGIPMLERHVASNNCNKYFERNLECQGEVRTKFQKQFFIKLHDKEQGDELLFGSIKLVMEWESTWDTTCTMVFSPYHSILSIGQLKTM